MSSGDLLIDFEEDVVLSSNSNEENDKNTALSKEELIDVRRILSILGYGYANGGFPQKLRELKIAYELSQYALQKSRTVLSFAWERNRCLERARDGSLDALIRPEENTVVEPVSVTSHRRYVAVVLDGNAAMVSHTYSHLNHKREPP